jgi:hypothetical protein
MRITHRLQLYLFNFNVLFPRTPLSYLTLSKPGQAHQKQTGYKLATIRCIFVGCSTLQSASGGPGGNRTHVQHALLYGLRRFKSSTLTYP